MYRGIVFYAGPFSRWQGWPAEREIIYEVQTPWLWAARLLARKVHSRLDAGRCGYAVQSLEQPQTSIEIVDATRNLNE